MISIKEALEYEVNSSVISSRVRSRWVQNILASYFARKVRKKYKNYKWNMETQGRLSKLKQPINER